MHLIIFRWLEEEAPAEYSRAVPADGFAQYARQVWGAILSSSELNIPSQKEMLATFRCEEIRLATLREVLPQLNEYASDPTQLFVSHTLEEILGSALRKCASSSLGD